MGTLLTLPYHLVRSVLLSLAFARLARVLLDTLLVGDRQHL